MSSRKKEEKSIYALMEEADQDFEIIVDQQKKLEERIAKLTAHRDSLEAQTREIRGKKGTLIQERILEPVLLENRLSFQELLSAMPHLASILARSKAAGCHIEDLEEMLPELLPLVGAQSEEGGANENTETAT